MKVILLKDCKDGKANTIIEVSNGYGTNFLVKKGFGVPYNPQTAKMLERKLDQLTADEHEKRTNFLKLKEELEQVKLKFELNANIDANHNLNVHGSISTKEVDKKLKELGFKIDKHALSKIHLVSEGNHEVIATLYKDIKAIIRIEIKVNVKK
ncbi:50S ribosomal protein L9 [Mycoplasmopsis glycophila]|uniref:Large ribosomal subunit protein bL9 n=1 Tax=Mycoplasmopsis glycophila TaxID=171285 RepID=A0A449AV57_9BACT|nr:50S ribosomal protein L9 [Mycoplasmopsis glycophila]VEU70397.1 50S ribosomal protein L9 [Mycoplasmopsis glycophila]